MPARMVVDLAEGNIVLFGGAPEPGTADAGLTNGFSRASAETFMAALASIGALVKTVEASIYALPKRPETIEIEFGATLSQECDLWIVSPEASPEFKIRLTWGKGG